VGFALLLLPMCLIFDHSAKSARISSERLSLLKSAVCGATKEMTGCRLSSSQLQPRRVYLKSEMSIFPVEMPLSKLTSVITHIREGRMHIHGFVQRIRQYV
jgi:hypothetical protein